MSTSSNAFLKGKQILDATLKAKKWSTLEVLKKWALSYQEARIAQAILKRPLILKRLMWDFSHLHAQG